VGKTAFLAWCSLWFLTCFFPAKIPCTAPTGHQLEDVLWPEIAKWLRILRERVPALGEQLDTSSDTLFLKAWKEESFAVARTARPENPEALQGFHSDNLLFLIDEASGVADKVFEVAEGALSTEGSYAVMAANPTRQSGYFFDSHHKMRAQWACIHVDGEKCERVSRKYVSDMARKYGTESPIYQIRVKGNFSNAIDGVIPLDLCESATNRDVKPTGGPIIWGVDVARFGDDSSAVAKRQGNHQLEPVEERYGYDTMQVAGWIKRMYDDTPGPLKPASINIDVIGIGAGVVDRLSEQGLPVYGVNVAESASSDERYSRLRDELWFLSKEWLAKKDCRLCEDEQLVGELTTPRYKVESNGKIKVEAKHELKKRGVMSPNKADAWNNTFANSGVASTKKPLKYPSMQTA
jgi:hypothetical protein